MNNIIDYINFFHNHGIEDLYISSYQINSINEKANNRLKAPYIDNIRSRQINFSEEILSKDIYGLGFNLKESNLAALDIDGCYDKIFLRNVLEILQLPNDYEWIIESGSESGFHIIYQTNVNDEFKKHVSKENASAFFSKYEHRPFSKIEFLFEGQLILPNSKHESGGTYTFVNNVPTRAPKIVDINNLIILHKIYCDTEADISKHKNGHVYKFKYKAIIDKKIDEVFQLKYRHGAKLIYNITAIDILFPNQYLIQITYFLMDKKYNILHRNMISLVERKDDINCYTKEDPFNDIMIHVIGEKESSEIKHHYYKNNNNLNEFLNFFFIENLEIITPVHKDIFFDYIFKKHTIIDSFAETNCKFKHKITGISELLNYEEIYKSNNPYKILYSIYYQYLNKEIKCSINDLFISIYNKRNEVFKMLNNTQLPSNNGLENQQECDLENNQWPKARDAFDDEEQYNDWLNN